MTFDDVICHFSGFCAPRGNLVREGGGRTPYPCAVKDGEMARAGEGLGELMSNE